MNSTIYTPEVMSQAGQIYDRLGQLPPEKRSLMKLVAEAFINGMITQERLAAPSAGEGLQQDTGQASA